MIGVYRKGCEVIGQAADAGVQITNRAILVKLRDPGAVMRGQGALASGIAALAPSPMTEALVYSGAAKKIKQGMVDNGIDADVSVVDPKNWKTVGTHLAHDIGFAVGGAGVLAAAWWFFRGRKR